MISGIMPCSGWNKAGYPWGLALLCWARVCDEIILVTHRTSDVGALLKGVADAVDNSKQEGRRCDIRIRPVEEPALDGFGGYGSYLLFGIIMASEPDWMLAVEADFLISPVEASRLRSTLQDASPSRDIVMARVVTMNYDGTRRLYNPDFKRWYTPFDGYTWDRPIGCRPKRGILPAPYGGTDRYGTLSCCEGYVCIQPGRWGSSFNSKFLNHNPYGFDIERTDVVVEHLTFTRNAASLIGKLTHPYFAVCGLNLAHVIRGDEAYLVDYAELRRVATDYSGQLKILTGVAGK